LKTFIVLKNEKRSELPSDIKGPDIRFSENLVEYFLNEFTREGDFVFDPFAGFGTTMRVAEAMNRMPYGLEYNSWRCEYARSRLGNPDHLVHGDARRLATYEFPPFDFSITSPPYMGKSDQENPFTDYSSEGAGYEQYLSDIGEIYSQMGAMMKSNARVVMEVSNLKLYDGLTTLAWDIAREVSKVLSFEGEIVIGWEETYGFGYDHSYCLVFKKQAR
jgi:DNA modification methylase